MIYKNGLTINGRYIKQTTSVRADRSLWILLNKNKLTRYIHYNSYRSPQISNKMIFDFWLMEALHIKEDIEAAGISKYVNME